MSSLDRLAELRAGATNEEKVSRTTNEYSMAPTEKRKEMKQDKAKWVVSIVSSLFAWLFSYDAAS